MWTLDIKKSTATPPEEVRKNLSVVIEKISEGSKRTWTYRGKKEVSDQVVHIWNRLMTRDGSIVYEVNPDHPMIDALVEEYPGIRPKIELILKQIAMSLPLNSLYIDLTNDEKLSNESEAKSSEIISVLTQLVAPYPAGDIRTAMINTLIQTEPFSAFIDEINDAMQRGEFND